MKTKALSKKESEQSSRAAASIIRHKRHKYSLSLSTSGDKESLGCLLLCGKASRRCWWCLRNPLIVPWGKKRTMERLRKRKDATSSPASVLAAGGAKRTRLANLASASNIDQEQRVDEEEHHQMGSITKNEPVIQQLGQIDSTVQQRLSSDPVISSAPSQSEVLMVALD
jgi:hypothetical protein